MKGWELRRTSASLAMTPGHHRLSSVTAQVLVHWVKWGYRGQDITVIGLTSVSQLSAVCSLSEVELEKPEGCELCHSCQLLVHWVKWGYRGQGITGSLLHYACLCFEWAVKPQDDCCQTGVLATTPLPPLSVFWITCTSLIIHFFVIYWWIFLPVNRVSGCSSWFPRPLPWSSLTNRVSNSRVLPSCLIFPVLLLYSAAQCYETISQSTCLLCSAMKQSTSQPVCCVVL